MRIDRTCPRCGRLAVMHARFVRAIHDWEHTFVECARLRCCGRTWTAAPRGVTPRARYSDRVILVAKLLAALGIPLRQTASLLRQTGVPLTAQTAAIWCRGVKRVGLLRVRLARLRGDLRLRRSVWLKFEGRRNASVVQLLDRTGVMLYSPPRWRQDVPPRRPLRSAANTNVTARQAITANMEPAIRTRTNGSSTSSSSAPLPRGCCGPDEPSISPAAAAR